MHNQNRNIYFFLICICFILFRTTSSASGEATSKIKKFNDVYATISENMTGEDIEKISRLWDEMDQIVVTALNAQADLSSVKHLVSELKGYQEPRTAQKTVIGNAVFFNEPDRQNPTYFLTDLNIDQGRYILGLYTYNDFTPGRLSIYSKLNRKWIRSDKFDGEYPITLYSFPDALNKGFFITVETFIGGDRDEGNVKAWQFMKGRLFKQGPSYDELVDYQIQSDRSSITVNFTKILAHICEPVLGTRLLFKITYQISDHETMESKKLSLTPWIEALEHYFELIEAGKIDDASRLSTDKSVIKKLTKDYCGKILEQNGSLEKGEGYVDLTDNKDYHIKLKEMNNTWLITGATEIVSSQTKKN
jgi:hypothetical protein